MPGHSISPANRFLEGPVRTARPARRPNPILKIWANGFGNAAVRGVHDAVGAGMELDDAECVDPAAIGQGAVIEIGDDALNWNDYIADPAAHLHLYGKPDVRPGRKMGHVTWVTPE